MSNTYFQFKRFRIEQARCAMKVGTDGVLLGAWADWGDPTEDDGAAGMPSASPLRLLDIGTGTGLIALMLAQRAASRVWGERPFTVTAVERAAAAAAQAKENAAASPWADRVTVVEADIRAWRPERADDSPATGDGVAGTEMTDCAPALTGSTGVSAGGGMTEVAGVEAPEGAAGTARSENTSMSAGSAKVSVAGGMTEVAGVEAPEGAATGTGVAATGMATEDVVAATTGAPVESAVAPLFDIIVCNPPFYNGSLKGTDAARNAARHNDFLKPDELFGRAAAWLKPAPAALNLVLPAEQEAAAINAAARHNLRPVRRCRVFTAPAAPLPNRVLLAFVRNDTPSAPPHPDDIPSRPTVPQLREETLHLYEPSLNGQHTPASRYTNEYRTLVKDFYLHF